MSTDDLRSAIDSLVKIIEDAITVLKQFIAGFKKTITLGEDGEEISL